VPSNQAIPFHSTRIFSLSLCLGFPCRCTPPPHTHTPAPSPPPPHIISLSCLLFCLTCTRNSLARTSSQVRRSLHSPSIVTWEVRTQRRSNNKSNNVSSPRLSRHECLGTRVLSGIGSSVVCGPPRIVSSDVFILTSPSTFSSLCGLTAFPLVCGQ
jgi:hypothetical protein